MSIVNASLQYLKVSDGAKLYYQKWMPEDPKAIIVFVHGLADHVGRYEPFTRYFSLRGYGVALFDMRGHGRSGGRKTHINRFYDYIYDLSQFVSFVKKNSPDVPVFLVGHSFGGQIVLNFTVRYSKDLRGIVALSPNIGVKLDMPEWKFKIAKVAVKCLPRYRIASNVNMNNLSHDENIVNSYRNDPNIPKDLTLKCGLEILKNSELVMALASRIHLPTLLMHGDSDNICDVEATKKFYMRVPGSSKQLKVYHGLYHELLNENGKERVFGDMEAWFEEQLDIEYRLAGSGGRKGR